MKKPRRAAIAPAEQANQPRAGEGAAEERNANQANQNVNGVPQPRQESGARAARNDVRDRPDQPDNID